MTTKIQPKFHIGDYIRWNEISKMEKFHGEIYDIMEFTNYGSCYLVQTPSGSIHVPFTEQDNWEKVFFYIENTLNEYRSAITGYFETLNKAMEGIKECSDWFRENGTGEIWMRGFGLKSHQQQVYRK